MTIRTARCALRAAGCCSRSTLTATRTSAIRRCRLRASGSRWSASTTRMPSGPCVRPSASPVLCSPYEPLTFFAGHLRLFLVGKTVCSTRVTPAAQPGARVPCQAQGIGAHLPRKRCASHHPGADRADVRVGGVGGTACWPTADQEHRQQLGDDRVRVVPAWQEQPARGGMCTRFIGCASCA